MSTWHRKKRGVQSLGRKVVLVLVALAMLGATIGFPVVARREIGGSTSFPCQHHACGCVSAEACWGGCCCFTPAQRHAWAKKNGVTPPETFQARIADAECEPVAFEEAEFDQEMLEQSEPVAGGKLKTQHAVKNCCASKREHHPSACAEEVVDTNHVAEHSQNAGKLTLGIAIGGLSQRCRGLSSMGLMVHVMVPVRQVTLYAMPEVAVFPMLDALSLSSDRPAPPVPPPRAVAV